MPTTLLDPDGTASMATLLMTSHHALRRDLACFARAADLAPLADEWTSFRTTLHHHHVSEDTTLFPDLRAKQPALAAALDQLDADHRAIDPLLERGDRAFAARDATAARDVIGELHALLAAHLDREERDVIPHLRGTRDFPPLDDSAVAMYADGFAWSCAGLAPAVVEQICALLPAALVERLPAARAAFDDRCRRTWGHAHAGTSLTSAP